jgi:hypothetical protein
MLRRSAITALGFAATATLAHAQAAVEYALKSSGGALSAGRPLYIGVCPVDRSFLDCASRMYPSAFRLTVLALLVLGVIALATRRRAYR